MCGRFSLGADATTLAALEAQPPVTQELVLRRLAAAWLAGPRRQHQAGEGGG